MVRAAGPALLGLAMLGLVYWARHGEAGAAVGPPPALDAKSDGSARLRAAHDRAIAEELAGALRLNHDERTRLRRRFIVAASDSPTRREELVDLLARRGLLLAAEPNWSSLDAAVVAETDAMNAQFEIVVSLLDACIEKFVHSPEYLAQCAGTPGVRTDLPKGRYRRTVAADVDGGRITVDFDSGACPELDEQYALLREMENSRNASLVSRLTVARAQASLEGDLPSKDG